MRLLITLADIRDGFIIAYGVVGIVFFFVGLIVAIGLFLSVRGLIRSLREVIDESVKPTLGSIRETADSVRGTTEFVSQTTITPILKSYGTFAAIRKGVGVLTGLSRKKRGK